jgi:membrane-associated phospholipid phosphatase
VPPHVARRRVSPLAIVLFCLASCHGVATAQGPPSTAHADELALGLAAPAEAEGLAWNEDWPRFRAWEYVFTGLVLAASPLLGGLEGSDEPVWRGPVWIDGLGVSVFALEDRTARDRIAKVSDYMWYGTQLFPLVVDSLLVAGLLHWNLDLSWQLAMIDLEAMLLAGLLSRLFHVTIGRDRPTAAQCAVDENHDSTCTGAGRNAGFYSGHTALSFTGAGLTCAKHAYLPLYGGGAVEALPCAATIVSAGAVGIMRLLANRHYLTDVIAGAFVGFAVGYLVPTLLHFTDDGPLPSFDDEDSGGGMFVLPHFTGNELGVSAAGLF